MKTLLALLFLFPALAIAQKPMTYNSMEEDLNVRKTKLKRKEVYAFAFIMEWCKIVK